MAGYSSLGRDSTLDNSRTAGVTSELTEATPKLLHAHTSTDTMTKHQLDSGAMPRDCGRDDRTYGHTYVATAKHRTTPGGGGGVYRPERGH